MSHAVCIAMLRELGPSWALWRSLYALALRGGWFRLLEARDAAAFDAPQEASLRESWQRWRAAAPFARHGEGLPPAWRASILDEAEAVREGRIRYFSGDARQVGHPPDWSLGEPGRPAWELQRHWSEVADLDPARGDIKWLWESSRFSHAVWLARAYALGGDERFAAAFWQQVEDWIERNPPGRGPNWRCAQECSLRGIAWSFALCLVARAESTHEARALRLLGSLHEHLRHVERLQWYARRCVRNNHAISEALFLESASLLFPFLPQAGQRARRALSALERELRWQVEPDGSYVQYSFNYARLVLQLLNWREAVRAQCAGPQSEVVQQAQRRLARFLDAFVDARSGRAPNHGPMDGAYLLPLSGCDFADLRPALVTAARQLGQPHRFGPGEWDEEAQWLGAPPARAGTPPTRPSAFAIGGFYRLQSAHAWAMLRCGTIRHRPHQADMLHCDLWLRGRNVLADAGSYSYNAAGAEHFASTAAHNTVHVDGRDQMDRGGRFVWTRWTRAHCEQFIALPDGAQFVGAHEAYAPVVHRRGLRLQGELLVVLDELEAPDGEHDFALQWLVGELAVEQLGPARFALRDDTLRLELRVCADLPSEIELCSGWQSLRYGERIARPSLQCRARGRRARFLTLVGPPAALDALRADELLSHGLGDWSGG